jgi:hypothetical protein
MLEQNHVSSDEPMYKPILIVHGEIEPEWPWYKSILRRYYQYYHTIKITLSIILILLICIGLGLLISNYF